MRPEFLPAFEAWLGDPGPGVIPAGTPFTQPEYVLAAEEESAELEAEATLAIDAAREANQVSDDFVLAAVLFASVLFFSGLAGTFDSFRAQVILLALAGVMLVMGTVIVLSLPQNVAF
jgi:hypothetical protein